MARAHPQDPDADPPGGEELDPEKSFAQTWREPPPPPDIPEVLQRPTVHTPGPASRPRMSSSLSGVGRAWGIALDFVFTILAGAGLGWLIGRWQGHMPGWVLGGLAVGFAAALVRIIRATQRQERLDKQARKGPR